MRILFLTSAHNSLSQRLWIELRACGHHVEVCVAATGETMIRAALREQPDLIIAPMLKIAIPHEVWSRCRCLIVHPGIRGDRGPSSLDWAIVNRETTWGVTILEAAPTFDSGAVWAAHEFPLAADGAKSSLYRGPVTEAAVRGILEAVARFESVEFRSGVWRPEAITVATPGIRGCLRPQMRQADRAIDWTRDGTAAIVRKIRAADSAPGVLAKLLGREYFLFGAHAEECETGTPGTILGQRDGAICLGTVDGAVWISHLKARHDGAPHRVTGIKLPAVQALGEDLHEMRELVLPIDELPDYRTFREIVYTERGAVGYLSFDFYNGAMSTSQCRRLRDAFLYARSRPTRVIVLQGGADFWSNGINLNTIEASADPGQESWRNINAIDDLILELLNTMSHLIVAGLRGNAGAGGAMLALAADFIYAQHGVVLNPHYRAMGNLYGSEYWTYTLPKRVGRLRAQELTSSCLPIDARTARDIGFIDDVLGTDRSSFETELSERAARLAADAACFGLLRRKQTRRLSDEWAKPLAGYRADELARMWINFFGPDRAYHDARRCFVFKGNPPPREPGIHHGAKREQGAGDHARWAPLPDEKGAEGAATMVR